MPNIRYTIQAMALVVAVTSFALTATAQADDVEVETLVTNLENPSGIAVNPETGHVFVASRYGVYRYVPDKHGVHLEIKGFPKDIYGKGPMYDIGPLGVAFLDNDHLVVGDGSRKDGDELVRIYKVGADPAEESASEDSAVYTLGPIKAGEQTAKGEGNFYGIAVGAGAIFVTCNGDDTKGWVSKIPVTDGKPGELAPAIATKEATNVDAPVAITFSADGNELIVGQMGEMNVPGDSLYTVYDPASGELKSKLETGLSDIAGIAVSPKTGDTYVVDFSWADTANGGLFRLKIDGDKVETEKIVSLDKPAALAFGKEGQLYLAVFGSKAEDAKDDKSPGSLAVIKPGL